MADYTPTGVPVTRSRPASAEIRNEFGLIATAIASKQNALVSGTSLKTVNGVTLLGPGNVAITKADVGLGSADNTADADKPISTAVAAALAGKQATLVSGSNIRTINGTSVLGSGDISISPGVTGVTSVNTRTGAVTLTASDVGLGSVNNTADADKPISTAVASALAGKADAAATTSALAGKQDTLVSGSNIRTVNGNSLLGSGDVTITATGGVTSVNTRTGAVTLTAADVGLGSVNNTADSAKPVSTAQQTALNAKLSIDGSIAMTGVLRVVDGTASAPGLGFSGAATTGLYRSGTTVGLSIAGTSAVTFTPAGVSALAVGVGAGGTTATVSPGVVTATDTSSTSATPFLQLTGTTTSYGTLNAYFFLGTQRNVAGGPWGHIRQAATGVVRRNMFETDMVTLTPMTVAQLPSAASVPTGTRAFVTDATSTTFVSVVVGGGGNQVPVYAAGGNWYIG